MNRYIIAGFISGIISGLFYLNKYLPNQLALVYGMIFGIALLWAHSKKIKLWRSILFIILSDIAFILSILIGISVGYYIITPQGIDPFSPIYLIAGFVGSFIIVISFNFLVQGLKPIFLLVLPILGALLMLTAYILPNENSEVDLYIFQVVWQVYMAAGIGLAVSSSKKGNNQEKPNHLN